MDKQLIKIPSQKIISFTDFSHLLSFSYFLFFFFFCKNENIGFSMFFASVHLKKIIVPMSPL